jgi:hypothetical protein
MLIAGDAPIRDRYKGMYIRPADVPGTVSLDMIQGFYEQRGMWSTAEEESKLFIGSQHALALTMPDQKPAILVQRGPVSFARSSGINQRRDHDMKTGSSVYTDLIQTSLAVNCMDVQPWVCDDVGSDMFELFGMLRHEHKRYGFFRMDGVTLSELRKMKDSVRPGNWLTVVTFSIMMQITWKVEQEASTLKTLVINLEDM